MAAEGLADLVVVDAKLTKIKADLKVMVITCDSTMLQIHGSAPRVRSGPWSPVQRDTKRGQAGRCRMLSRPWSSPRFSMCSVYSPGRVRSEQTGWSGRPTT